MAATGCSALIIGSAQLAALGEITNSWLLANTLMYLGIALICFTSLALNWTPWLRASEALMILSAYVGTAGVIVTGLPDTTIVIGVAAFGLVPLLPGIAIRTRSSHVSAFNLFAVCVTYIGSMFLRFFLRDGGASLSVGEVVIYIVSPPFAYLTGWFMVRALNHRVLEALAESERARGALQHTLAHQVVLNDALVQFVPQEFLTSLGRHDISEVKLGDSVTKTMSILFADINGYTKLVEGMPPQATIDLLNDLFGALEPAIVDHHGFVDSYIGDAIMALFDGTPRNAIDAALAMLTALRRHNEARRARGLADIAIGIGINTGVVTLGTNGGARRLKCSVFGDAVNLAARIEHLTRRYEVSLLVSEHTMELTGADHGHDIRTVDRVSVVGRSAVTTLYEVYDADPEPRRAAKRAVDAEYYAGVAAFYDRRFAEALAAFERCLATHDDAVIRSYAARSRALAATPPDPAWTGVEVLQQK